VAWSVQSEPTGAFGRRVGVEVAAEDLYDPRDFASATSPQRLMPHRPGGPPPGGRATGGTDRPPTRETPMASRILQHVNVVYPPGAEAEARAFYAGTLGLDEVAKPPEFDRLGMWFQLQGGGQVHLSPGEPPPPGPWHFCVVADDFDALRGRIEAAGAGIEDTHPWEGRRRMFTRDPWGGRVEVLEGPAPIG
jgi:catechol 2,3-dioxygenase-like lactoylglutathione lyase family enzyme